MAKNKISLTKEELKEVEGNKIQIIQKLVNKGLLKEALEKKYTEEEKEELKKLEERVRIDYFLNVSSRDNLSITKEEIEEVYRNNKKNIGNKTLTEVQQEIVNKLHVKKVNDGKFKAINKVVEKYDIDKLVEEYLKG